MKKYKKSDFPVHKSLFGLIEYPYCYIELFNGDVYKAKVVFLSDDEFLIQELGAKKYYHPLPDGSVKGLYVSKWFIS